MSKKFFCKFFNMDGCNKSADECIARHEKCCNNKLCIKSNTHLTHKFEDCGRPGGPRNAEYRASMQAQAPVPATKDPKVLISKARNLLLEAVYVKVEEMMTKHNAELVLVYEILPNPGKIVGMFDEALTFVEIFQLLTDQVELDSRLAEALDTVKKARLAETA